MHTTSTLSHVHGYITDTTSALNLRPCHGYNVYSELRSYHGYHGRIMSAGISRPYGGHHVPSRACHVDSTAMTPVSRPHHVHSTSRPSYPDISSPSHVHRCHQRISPGDGALRQTRHGYSRPCSHYTPNRQRPTRPPTPNFEPSWGTPIMHHENKQMSHPNSGAEASAIRMDMCTCICVPAAAAAAAAALQPCAQRSGHA